MQPDEVFPVEILFHLLCICRRRENSTPQALRAAIHKRWLHSIAARQQQDAPALPRVDFLLRLCQAAGLLDDTTRPCPTLLVEEWLSWPLHQQIEHLLNAWAKAPASEDCRRTRTGLIQNLQQGNALQPAQRRELAGLQFLGICAGDQLTGWGSRILAELRQPAAWAASRATIPWKLNGAQLCVSFPPNLRLLWALEEFLDSHLPGMYLLDEKNLRLAAQRGALQCSPSLPEIIEQGTGAPMPPELLHQLAAAPTIHLVRGFVLEFSHPQELHKLRKTSSWRRALNHLLSPRHVALDPWQGYTVLRRLQQRGLLSEQELAIDGPPDYPVIAETVSFSKADRVYLLSLALLSNALQAAIAPPPGLMGKLAAGLDHPLRAAAARKASTAAGQIRPKVEWPLPETAPAIPPQDLAAFLQNAIRLGESVDLWYQASDRHTPELRHLTPLLVEERANRYYLIAYCHTRRANRTFRLDRVILHND